MVLKTFSCRQREKSALYVETLNPIQAQERNLGLGGPHPLEFEKWKIPVLKQSPTMESVRVSTSQLGCQD